MRSRPLLAAVLIGSALSCVGLPPEPPGQTASGSVGSGPATGMSTTVGVADGSTTSASAPSSTTASAESTTTGPGPTGSSGVEVPMLVDTGLLARWYVDEAAEQQAPVSLLDYAPDPLNLEMIYVGDSPVFIEIDGNRGLSWSSVGLDGRPAANVQGTKIDAVLGGGLRGTFEVVAAVTNVFNQGSRLLHIGRGTTAGDIALQSNDIDTLNVNWRNNLVRAYEVVLSGSRQVFHLVIDTSEVVSEDRIRLYIDGILVPPELILNEPGHGSDIDLSADAILVLGNRNTGDRSFAGSLHYGAIYSEALGADSIAHNAALLLDDDDSP